MASIQSTEIRPSGQSLSTADQVRLLEQAKAAASAILDKPRLTKSDKKVLADTLEVFSAKLVLFVKAEPLKTEQWNDLVDEQEQLEADHDELAKRFDDLVRFLTDHDQLPQGFGDGTDPRLWRTAEGAV